MVNSSIQSYGLINHETGCQYLFQDYSKSHGGSVVVHIDDGHGWRTYDSTMVGGNYAVTMARTLWNSLIEQGFVTNG
jgi:hypothetical protein